MLFSEPKIPQYLEAHLLHLAGVGFSALQRAENSSIRQRDFKRLTLPEFQCSSASRKFLNRRHRRERDLPFAFQCSSASRKFLNTPRRRASGRCAAFQCSSASRKFLNVSFPYDKEARRASFSALQRAENSSIIRRRSATAPYCRGFSALQRAENSSIKRWLQSVFGQVPFQCSSASRKFLNGRKSDIHQTLAAVSVLFSEPKIPQS